MKNIANISLIKYLINEFTSGLKVSLGQNYLISERVLKQVLKIVNPSQKQTFIEIGPGIGVFSYNLVFLSKYGYLIEIDSDKISALNKVLENYDNFKIFNDDAKKINYKKNFDKVDFIFGALPYNNSKKIIFNLLSQHNFNWKAAYFILQKEVAMKFAGIDSKNNFLNRYISLYADVTYEIEIEPKSFYPRPRVDSALIKLLKKDNVDIEETNKLRKIIKQGYSQPRKKVRNNIKTIINNFDKSLVSDTILNKRPDEVTIQEWKVIANLI